MFAPQCCLESAAGDVFVRYLGRARLFGGTVGVLMVICPVTGKEFSTGIETDEQSLDLIPTTVAQAQCPHCGANHSWSKLEARLSETGAPAE